MSKALGLVVLLLGLLLAAGPLAHNPAVAATARHTLSLEVHRAEGPPVLLQFLVAAATPGDALAAARRTAAGLVPGGYVSEGSVSAQWAAWGWKWADDELPVTVAYNPTGAPSSVGPQAVIAGIQAWSSVPDSRFAFRYGGITDNAPRSSRPAPTERTSSRGVRWSATLAACLESPAKRQRTKSTCSSTANPEAATQVGIDGTLDWRTVILHELGHIAGSSTPARSPLARARMRTGRRHALPVPCIQRKLEADDIAGVVALYPLAPSAAPSPGVSPTLPVDVPWCSSRAGTSSSCQHWNGCARLPAVVPHRRVRVRSRRVAVVDPRRTGLLQSLSATRPGSAHWLLASGPCATTVAPGP